MTLTTRSLIAMLLLGAISTGWAETRYVTDEFKITMRSGESASHKILRMLPSGTPVVVLASNRDTGYSHVRYRDQEGYVLTRQLISEPVARERLAELEQRLIALKKAPGELASQLDAAKQELARLQAEHRELAQAKQTIEQELVSLQRTSANAVRIANERSSLRKQVAELTEQNAELTQQNTELGNTNLQNWFMVGAGVLAGGILLGLILPNLRLRRRQNSWSSL